MTETPERPARTMREFNAERRTRQCSPACSDQHTHTPPCRLAPAPGLPQCPTCGPTPTEPHPRLPGVDRCANCKTHVATVCSGEEGFCAPHGFHRHAPAPDGLREQYMAAIIRGGGCVDLAAATDAVLAVRDAELLRLRTETATYRLQIDDLIRRNSEYAERAIANGERADKADRALEQQLADARAETAIAAQLRVDVQRERDRLAATVERVRRLAERWENALTPDRPYARALRTALDEPRDGAGADTARRCGSTLTHPSHKFMRLHVVFNCPGTTPEDPS